MAAITADSGFSIGRVIQRLVSALQANLGPFLLLSALLSGLPIFLSGCLQVLGQNPILAGLLGLVMLVFQLWGAFMLQATLIAGALSHFDEERSSIGDWLSKGLAHWWRVLLVDLLSGLIIGAAWLLFVVPGIMMATRYAVAVPAQISEGLRVNQSLARSAQLTSGRRWAIFGLFLLYFVPVLITEGLVVVTAVATSPGGFAGAVQSPIFRLLMLPLLNSGIALIAAVGLAALYAELRIGRESPTTLNVAKVFD